MQALTLRLISLMVLILQSSTTVSAEITNHTSEEEKIAADLANPLAPITTLFFQYRAEFGNGPENDINQQFRIQPSFFKPFADKSAVLLRTVVPFASRTWPINKTGLGDISLIPYYVPDTSKPAILGYGLSLGVPSATDDALGSGKWTAGPAFLFAKTGQPYTYGSLFQHIWSVAGDDNRADISVSTIQPFFTYLLGEGWSATLLTEASYNWKANSNHWTIPINLGFSKVISIGKRYFNLGLTAVYYLEAPSPLYQDSEIRLNFTYVIR